MCNILLTFRRFQWKLWDVIFKTYSSYPACRAYDFHNPYTGAYNESTTYSNCFYAVRDVRMLSRIIKSVKFEITHLFTGSIKKSNEPIWLLNEIVIKMGVRKTGILNNFQ